MLPKEKKIDPRVMRTRKLLEQAFMELIEEKSFVAITVQDIADRATVNRATFYAHFEDKYALFDYIIRQTFQETLRNKLTTGCEFSLDNLKLLILAVCEYMARLNHSCSTADKQILPLIETQVQAQLYEFILDWIKPQPPQETQGANTPEITATVMSWTIFGAGVRCSQADSENSAKEDIAQTVLLLMTEGLFGAGQLTQQTKN